MGQSFAVYRKPVLSENSIIVRQNHRILESDVCNPARARNVCRRPARVGSRLEAENLLLRHQLTIAMRQAPPRLRLRGSDRALLTWMTRVWPGLLGAVQVVQPETVLRWHRAGFKMFWRWKSRHRAGRPPKCRPRDFRASARGCLFLALSGHAKGPSHVRFWVGIAVGEA